MRKNILFLILCCCTCWNLHSQENITANQYNINQKIVVTSIVLEIHHSAIYTKPSLDNEGKVKITTTPISVTLCRKNNKESYYYFNYSEVASDTLSLDKEKIVLFNTKIFDSIVKKLNTIKINKMQPDDFNTFDGSSYYLSFSSENYKVSLEAYSPQSRTNLRNLKEFLEVCELISNLTHYY
ncbi:hypothetical protein [Flavobacterium aciduliphilum]|uniref:Uncharacterized protein n=1 Tax=Flavobacterium aciduliphilum TaxID=1101402 RepID=A0A328YY99_9FLAO|nr:hypothetical protein [Flavobacterium aciduliphilum]RAR75507.1 hypothetical protein CLV55_101207 [Flavobacterium aciduliphilum]